MIVRDHACNYGHRLGPSCHLASTLCGEAGTKELLAFAKSIGLRDSWIQYRGAPNEHFDLFGSRIEAADRAGATLYDRRQFVNVVRVKRGDAPFPTKSLR